MTEHHYSPAQLAWWTKQRDGAHARRRAACQLRFNETGDVVKSYAEVGRALGVNRERARQLVVTGLRRKIWAPRSDHPAT